MVLNFQFRRITDQSVQSKTNLLKRITVAKSFTQNQAISVQKLLKPKGSINNVPVKSGKDRTALLQIDNQ